MSHASTTGAASKYEVPIPAQSEGGPAVVAHASTPAKRKSNGSVKSTRDKRAKKEPVGRDAKTQGLDSAPRGPTLSLTSKSARSKSKQNVWSTGGREEEAHNKIASVISKGKEALAHDVGKKARKKSSKKSSAAQKASTKKKGSQKGKRDTGDGRQPQHHKKKGKGGKGSNGRESPNNRKQGNKKKNHGGHHGEKQSGSSVHGKKSSKKKSDRGAKKSPGNAGSAKKKSQKRGKGMQSVSSRLS
jgi:hypothetical protein